MFLCVVDDLAACLQAVWSWHKHYWCLENQKPALKTMRNSNNHAVVIVSEKKMVITKSGATWNVDSLSVLCRLFPVPLASFSFWTLAHRGSDFDQNS
jgi:hypothetical protein